MAFSKFSFDEFFDTIPFLPLVEICRHLSPADHITYSLSSDRWRDAIKSSGGRQKALVKVMFKEEVDEIQVLFPDDTANCFHVKFEESPSDGRSVDLERKVSNDIHHYNYCVDSEDSSDGSEDASSRTSSEEFTGHWSWKFYARKIESLEETFLRFFDLLGEFFTLEYDRITVNPRESRLNNCFRLLASMPPGIVRFFNTRCFEEPLNFEHLEKCLSNFRVTEWLNINAPLDGVFDSQRMLLDGTLSMCFADARFLTKHHMETMEFWSGTFGINTLKSEDFNVFFRRWKEDTLRQKMEDVNFKISEDQKIDLEEVVKGLDAKPWDPMVRDRQFYVKNLYNSEWIDAKDGLDIINADGTLGTVLLTGDHLKFCLWSDDKFPLQREERKHLENLRMVQEMLESEKVMMQWYEENRRYLVSREPCSHDRTINHYCEWIKRLKEKLENLNKLK